MIRNGLLGTAGSEPQRNRQGSESSPDHNAPRLGAGNPPQFDAQVSSGGVEDGYFSGKRKRGGFGRQRTTPFSLVPPVSKFLPHGVGKGYFTIHEVGLAPRNPVRSFLRLFPFRSHGVGHGYFLLKTPCPLVPGAFSLEAA